MNGFRMPNSIGELAIWVVAIAAIVALMYVALHQFGIAIPEWVKAVFWIVVVALVVIGAIKWITGVGTGSKE
jgi:hypothetical protein